MTRRVRAVVSGLVQGVNFRAFTRREAERLGLAGWVRNLEDGRVELEAEGETGTVERLLESVRKGPPVARVERLDVSELPPAGLAGFDVRGTAHAPEGMK